MKISKVSALSGKIHTLDINVTYEQIEEWHNGMLIQEAMPNVSADEREFIKTGITPEEWNEFFGEGEES